MTKFIGIVSAKGGVGKTTTTINLTTALHEFKRKAVALDANFANPDLSIHLGAQNLKKTLHTALKGKHGVNEIMYKHPSGIYIVPGSISYKEARSVKRQNLMGVIYQLLGSAEAVIIDSTPGLGRDARTVIRASDYLIVVTTPDLVSVTGSLKIINLAHELDKQVLGVVVNKRRQADYEMPLANIQDFLDKPIIGVIPEDAAVRHSLCTKNPVVLADPFNPASIGFKKAAGLLIGQKYEEHIKREEDKSLFSIALERFGLK